MDGFIAFLIIAAFVAFVVFGEISKYKANKAFKEAQYFLKAKITELQDQLANLKKK